MDTIYALATAQGRAGVAVVRASGPRAHDAIAQLSGIVPKTRRATVVELRDQHREPIDQALVLAFDAGASFTGEDVAEFQIHGSRATIAALLRALGMLESFRLAEPGEFTRRALENGRMDLTEVEGLADLLEAETEAQRQQALRTLSGALGAQADVWRTRLVRAMALLEATIDFADEEIPENVTPEVEELLLDVIESLRTQSRGVDAAERVRDGFEIAILGPPNIGKSTLLNALAGREAALTSEHAGTTRDVIEVRMDIDGLPVTFLDTAGLRDTDDPIENMGIDRAMQRASQADLRVVLHEGKVPPGTLLHPDDIDVLGKADQTGEGISGKTGEGVTDLLGQISKVLSDRVAGVGVAVHERHRMAIRETVVLLESALEQVRQGSQHVDLAAEELRHAVRRLDALVGRVDVENILDEVFSSFCVGK